MNDIRKIKNAIIICLLCISIAVIIIVISNIKPTNDKGTYNNKFINQYKSNQFENILMNEQDVVELYLLDFSNNIRNNKEEAYNSLNELYRVKKFGNLENFIEYIKDYDQTYIELYKYSKQTINGQKIFNCIDKRGDNYIIKEKSIMNYEIYLDLNTVEIE